MLCFVETCQGSYFQVWLSLTCRYVGTWNPKFFSGQVDGQDMKTSRSTNSRQAAPLKKNFGFVLLCFVRKVDSKSDLVWLEFYVKIISSFLLGGWLLVEDSLEWMKAKTKMLKANSPKKKLDIHRDPTRESRYEKTGARTAGRTCCQDCCARGPGWKKLLWTYLVKSSALKTTRCAPKSDSVRLDHDIKIFVKEVVVL